MRMTEEGLKHIDRYIVYQIILLRISHTVLHYRPIAWIEYIVTNARFTVFFYLGGNFVLQMSPNSD